MVGYTSAVAKVSSHDKYVLRLQETHDLEVIIANCALLTLNMWLKREGCELVYYWEGLWDLECLSDDEDNENGAGRLANEKTGMRRP